MILGTEEKIMNIHFRGERIKKFKLKERHKNEKIVRRYLWQELTK